MITVTREGVITGDYWEGIRKVERQRAGQAIADKERQQEEQYAAAMKSAIKPPKGAKKKRKKKKLTLHDKHGARLYKLYQEGLSAKEAAAIVGVSYATALSSINKTIRSRGRRA